MKTCFQLIREDLQNNSEDYSSVFIKTMDALEKGAYEITYVNLWAIQQFSIATPKCFWKNLFGEPLFAQPDNFYFVEEFGEHLEPCSKDFVSLLEINLDQTTKVAFLLNEDFDLLLAEYNVNMQCYIVGDNQNLAHLIELRIFQLFYDFLSQIEDSENQVISKDTLDNEEYMEMYTGLCQCQGAVRFGFNK